MKKHLFYPVKILFSILALFFMVACGGTEPDVPLPGPTPPNPTQDTKAPVISIKIQEQNVIAGVKVDIKTDQILFDQTVAATWKDDISKSCKVDVGFIGEGGAVKAVKSGDRLEEPGKLQIKVTDEAGNDSSAEIKLTRVDSWAPEISILIGEKNVVAGIKFKVDGNQLFLDDQMAASWKDDYSESLTVDIQYFPENSSTGKAIESGETLFDAGKLQIAVQDDAKNKSTAEIKLTSVAITGLESLMGKELTVDVPVNLLEGLTIAEGLTLQKVEIEKDGVKSEIPNPKVFTPESIGTISLIITLERTDRSTIVVTVTSILIKTQEYNGISIFNIKPGAILPVVEQVDEGDTEAYNHIDHLRLAEATRIRDMMWEYGSEKHSKEEYQSLMARLNVGMIQETPLGYSNFDYIGGQWTAEPDNHAHVEWSILNSLIKYANLKTVDGDRTLSWHMKLIDYVINHPNDIHIFWCSAYADADSKSEYDIHLFRQNIIDLCSLESFALFAAGTNIKYVSWVLKNRVYNGEYEAEEHGAYSLCSMSNSDKNTHPDSHLLVTIATDKTGDIDQTKETGISSKFPIGFADNVLFAGRIFPYHSYNIGRILATDGKYATSEPNYVNVAMSSLCFQLYAEVADIDELLDMIRSTALTDYIRFDLNGDGDTNDIIDGHPETLPLQLINPGGFFKKYGIAVALPSAIGPNETIDLTKEWYKGLIFNIPGTEVKVNGEWIPFDAKNKDLILSQNPMNLEWRINGSLLKKYGYTSGQTIQGKIITVDDQWNGLRLEKEFSVQVR